MAAHYYHPKTGELIDGNLRDARKVNGLPSPTTVLGILGSPGLTWYFKRQMWEATITTPRPPGMGDEDYWELCQKWAEEHGAAARDKGTDFHDLAQAFHLMCMKYGGLPKNPFMPISDPLASQFNAYVDWYSKNIRRSLLVEQSVIGQGYAGRVDHVAEFMDGSVGCIDVKTQDTTKKKGKFTYYSNWGVQLGAYAGACKPMPHFLMSIAVGSTQGSTQVEAYRWPKEPAYYHNIFLGLLEYWKEDNSYWPTL
jgi:hypothetical protein